MASLVSALSLECGCTDHVKSCVSLFCVRVWFCVLSPVFVFVLMARGSWLVAVSVAVSIHRCVLISVRVQFSLLCRWHPLSWAGVPACISTGTPSIESKSVNTPRPHHRGVLASLADVGEFFLCLDGHEKAVASRDLHQLHALSAKVCVQPDTCLSGQSRHEVWNRVTVGVYMCVCVYGHGRALSKRDQRQYPGTNAPCGFSLSRAPTGFCAAHGEDKTQEYFQHNKLVTPAAAKLVATRSYTAV